jgi:hypothetical protein
MKEHRLKLKMTSLRQGHHVTRVTPENILSAYISTTTNTSSLDNLHESTLLKSIFLELNTALQANAAGERLFSVAGRVFMPNRTTTTEQKLRATASVTNQFKSVKLTILHGQFVYR